MIASLALAIVVIVSGTVTTYLYDENASLGARLCAGACLGLTALGLVGFVIASFTGLTVTAVFLSAILTSTPLVSLLNKNRRNRFSEDLADTSRSLERLVLHPDLIAAGYVIFYAVIAITLWQVFSRAMIVSAEGISTGLLNNFGDLPFHLSVITRFAYGNNLPPEDPTYAGVRFTYPFLSDFVAAMFVRCGADLQQSMFIENFILGLAFVGLLHRWALVMLRDRFAAVITPLLVLLNGGLGWVLLFSKADKNEGGLFGLLHDLPPSFTVIPETTWRWGNAISALLVPQRGFLMGLPLAVIVFTQWWLATEDAETRNNEKKPNDRLKSRKSPRKVKANLRVTVSPSVQAISIHRMVAAGVAAGFLPLVHAHSFVVVMGMGACIALLLPRWREWAAFFLVASVIAVPQLLWSTSHSAVKAASFFSLEFGWDRNHENAIWFWFKNTGVFIPLTLVAILWKDKVQLVSKRLLLFYLPFTLCFVIPNFMKMAPWIWDNIKVLFYWWLASAPLVALVLARLWRQGPVQRSIAVVLFVCLTLAGALDVGGIALRSVKYGIFDSAGISFAELIKEQTAPHSLIVHAPVHNHPVFLSGRRSLMGYPGHIWTHGLEFAQREAEIKRIYAGAPDAEQLLRNYKIDYAVVSPLERHALTVNEQFFLRYQKVGEVGEYRLYKITH
jgi:hypothetical protein